MANITLVNKILSHEGLLCFQRNFSRWIQICKFFHHPQFLYNGIFYYWFFKILAIFFSDFFWMNKYFKLFRTQGGHIQFTIIKSLAVCAQKQVVNETNVDSWH
jgi:hypothetical protein